MSGAGRKVLGSRTSPYSTRPSPKTTRQLSPQKALSLLLLIESLTRIPPGRLAGPLVVQLLGQVLVRLFSIARSFDMEIQPQLVLLQKTLLNIEGLGRQLYPQLDLWQTAQPVLREWMEERTGPKAIMRRFKSELPEIRYMLDQLPTVARKLMERLDEVPAEPAPDRKALLAEAKQRYLVFSGGVFVLAGAVLLGMQAEPEWLGWGLAGLGSAMLFLGRPRT